MQEWIHALYFTLFKNIYEYVTFFPVKIQSQNYQVYTMKHSHSKIDTGKGRNIQRVE